MHPTAQLATPLIVLLQDATCLRTWLESLQPCTIVGQKLSCIACPIVAFLKAHAVPVEMADPAWITLITGQEIETPGWMSLLIDRIDTSLTMQFNCTTLDLDVTAYEVLALIGELDDDDKE